MFRRRQTDINLAIFAIGIDAILTIVVIFVLDSRCEQIAPFIADSGQCFPSWSYIVVTLSWMTSFLLGSVYDPARALRAVDEFQNVILSVAFGILLFAGFVFLFGLQVPRDLFLVFVFMNLAVLLGWRIVIRVLDRRRAHERNTRVVLIVGNGRSSQQLVDAIADQLGDRIRLIGYLNDERQGRTDGLPIIGKPDDIRQVVSEQTVDEVIFALPSDQFERTVRLILDIDDLPVRVRVIPNYFNLTYHRMQVENFLGIPLIGLRDPQLNNVQLLIKRILDIVLALLGLLLLWPLFLLVAIAVKLDSEGPAVFKQTRIGENRRPFCMYKFRSMRLDTRGKQADTHSAESMEVMPKRPDDPRVTRVGRFIRRTSLDELPQLINILRGDMSFVGPRPEMPRLVERYEPWQRVRFSVPQGLTGWWQVNGRSDKPMYLNTQDDLYYIENYSLWLDLQILLKTPLVVLRGKGAF